MEKIFSVGKAAAMTGLTAEALRHYDRIGLVVPHGRDGATHYRYYTDDDLVTLRTVGLLRDMELPLAEIGDLLAADDLRVVAEKLNAAEARAYRKIDSIERAIGRMRRARAVYEKLIAAQDDRASLRPFRRELPARALFVSAKRSTPHTANLWQYHNNFYAELGAEKAAGFAFADVAGFVDNGGERRLCAVCERYDAASPQIRLLSAGEYLCCYCTDETMDAARELLAAELRSRGRDFPASYVTFVRIIGLLKWDYEMQIFSE